MPAKNEIKTAAVKLRGIACGCGAACHRSPRHGSVVEPQLHAARVGEVGGGGGAVKVWKASPWTPRVPHAQILFPLERFVKGFNRYNTP